MPVKSDHKSSKDAIQPKTFMNLLRQAFAGLGNFRGVAALVAVFVLGIIYSPRNAATGWPIFLTAQTQKDILFEYAEYGILATGMTLVILAGGIDLSVGSVLGFAATFFSLLVMGFGWSPMAAILATVVAGGAIGFINGAIISKFKMQPFVVTLATMVAARGAAKWISHGMKVQPGAEPW
jgi:ribose transport system permease protein